MGKSREKRTQSALFLTSFADTLLPVSVEEEEGGDSCSDSEV